jgi:hypothetical protein
MTKSVLENATAHFQEQVAGKMLSMKVNEWKSTVYYRTTSSMRTESKIMALTAQGKTAEALVESIVLKALDKNGDRLFKETDRATLLNEADPKVLIRVATKLNNASEPLANVEGN